MTNIYVNPGDNPQSAANDLKSGDELIFRSGIHHGMFWVPAPEVTVRGENGAILDGTLPLDSDDWEEATDSDNYCNLSGKGVWRVRQPQQVWVLTDGGENQVHRLDSRFINVKETAGYYYMTAYEALAVPNNARPGQDYGADWWNGIEALFCYNKQNGYLYLRFRDGRRPPDGMRWSGGMNTHGDPPMDAGTCIMLWEHGDIAIKDLSIRGAFDLIAPYRVNNVTVENCKFRCYDYATRPYSACQNIKVLRSDFNSGLYGTTAVPPVAKISAEEPYPDIRLTSYHQYAMWKFWATVTYSTNGAGCSCQGDEQGYPNNIEFAYNYVCNSNFGADAGGDGNYFHHNTIEHMMDMPFQRSGSQHGRNVHIYDNVVNEAGYTLIRWHEAHEEAGDNYFYNNRIGAMAQVGDFIFLAAPIWEEKGQPSQLRINIYHNSTSGGHLVFQINDMSEMPGFLAVNNLISHDGRTSIGYLWPQPMGGYDWNFMSGNLDAWGDWRGPNNVSGMAEIWDTTKVEKEFIVPDGHPSKGAGVDVTQPFMIGGRTFGPLPGFEPGYSCDVGWIDRGEEPPEPPNGGEEVEATLAVDKNMVEPGDTVKISWTGVTDAEDWIGLYLIDTGDEDYLDWIYSTGSQEPGVVESGSRDWVMPSDPDSYEFRLYKSNSYERLAETGTILVEENVEPPEPTDKILVYVPMWIPADTEMSPDIKPDVSIRIKELSAKAGQALSKENQKGSTKGKSKSKGKNKKKKS